MRLVRNQPTRPADPALRFAATPLSVVFADAAEIDDVRARGEGALSLSPPFHVSDDDRYLVLPDDIGLELIDIMKDGDLDLLRESLRDGLLVEGTIGRNTTGMALLAERAVRPSDVIERLPYGARVHVGASDETVEEMNALGHVRVTVLSQLVDGLGLQRMLCRAEHVGASWRVPEGKAAGGVDPTYVWSRRADPGHVGVELALFSEYEELVVLLRPVELVAA